MPNDHCIRPLGLLARLFWDVAGLLFLPLVWVLSLIFEDNKTDPMDPD